MTEPTERFVHALRDRYAIERELGRGGMATVFLARDLKHERRVAVKVLHANLAATIGAARFLGEIKTTANLQHPHILTLHDSGEADGFLYYVMPFVDGESLRARLTREKQLPIEEAVRIVREVADALAYAHQQGVVHRDIKPENILLQGGHALVADFGIALAVQQAGGSRLTETGLSIGTPHYMSPEQALGERAIDQRADIYALGAVMYEMLTGEPPFTGATLQAVIAKITTERPLPPTHIRDTTPQHVEVAVMKALAKLPADRFSSAGEFATALERRDTLAAPWGASTLRPGLTWRRAALPTAGGMAVLLLVGWLGVWLGRSNIPDTPPSSLSVSAPMLRSSGGGSRARNLAITPDGSILVFIGAFPTGAYPMLQRLNEMNPIQLNEALGFGAVVPTADGRTLLGLIGARLSRVSLDGGKPTVGPRIATNFFAAHPDGSVWFSRPPYTTLERIPPGEHGDSLEVMFTGLPSLKLYQILDDGRTAILVQFQRLGDQAGRSVIMDLRTGKHAPVLDTEVREARYTSGHLVHLTASNSLFAVPFDIGNRRSTGSPVRIGDRVESVEQGIGQFAVSRNGTVAYIPVDDVSLVLVGRDGSERRAYPEQHSYHGPRFSPDGRRIAVDFTGSSGRDVWVLDVQQSLLQRLTFHDGADVGGHDPTWTPDGKHVSYIVQRDSVWQAFQTLASGGTAPEPLFSRRGGLAFTGSWLHDASAVITVTGVGGEDIAIVRNAGRGSIEPLVADSAYREVAPAPSPDGRLVAYVSDESGQYQVFVKSLGNDSARIQVSLDGGLEPVWSRDGRELFYRRVTADEEELVSARIEDRPTLRVVERRALFDASGIVSGVPHANYDVSPDGKTFVMVRRNPAARIVVIQNLPGLVRQLRANPPSSR